MVVERVATISMHSACPALKQRSGGAQRGGEVGAMQPSYNSTTRCHPYLDRPRSMAMSSSAETYTPPKVPRKAP